MSLPKPGSIVSDIQKAATSAIGKALPATS
jgi:hypothetical protein